MELKAYGVVVWAGSDQDTIVIWCEDGKSLAYMMPDSGRVIGLRRPKIGDLVWVRCRVAQAVRSCTEICVVKAGYRPGIVEEIHRLRDALTPPVEAEVVNFPPAGRAGLAALEGERRRRRPPRRRSRVVSRGA